MKLKSILSWLLILLMTGVAGAQQVTPSRSYAPFLKLGRQTPSTTTDTLYNPAGVLTYNGKAVVFSDGSTAFVTASYANVIDNGTTHAPTYGTAENPTIDWTKGNIQKITSSSTGSATPTVAFIAPSGPCVVILKITHEATTTAITYTWPVTVKWPAGVKPTTTNTSGAVDVIALFYDGAAYYQSGLDLR